jgi:hypothetical protein
VVCLKCVIVKPRQGGGRGPLRAVASWGGGKKRIGILISGFRRDVDAICALLGYYAARTSLSLKMGPIRSPETSVNNYHTTPRNIPEERRSHWKLPLASLALKAA